MCINKHALGVLKKTHLGIAIGIDRVICKADFIALSHGIHTSLQGKIEEETADDLVVDSSSSLGLILTHHLATVLVDEIILHYTLFQEYTPSGKEIL